MDYFLQALASGVVLASFYTLVAIGLTLVFGVVRIINFVHGEFVMLGAYATYWLYLLGGVHPLLGLPLTMLGLFVFGAFVHSTVVARVLDAPHENQILLTFGIHLIIQNAVLLLWTSDSRSIPLSYAIVPLTFGPVTVGLGRLLAGSAAVMLIALLFLWLRYTKSGKAIRAVAQNETAARLIGVSPRRMYLLAFAVSAALGGAAGSLSSTILAITPEMGLPLLIKAFVVVLLGGVGSIIGTVLGALVLGTAEAFAGAYLPMGGTWAEGVGYLILLAVLAFRPQGLLGRELKA
jgi:branched-chain amino acid transport system permease protein